MPKYALLAMFATQDAHRRIDYEDSAFSSDLGSVLVDSIVRYDATEVRIGDCVVKPRIRCKVAADAAFPMSL